MSENNSKAPDSLIPDSIFPPSVAKALDRMPAEDQESVEAYFMSYIQTQAILSPDVEFAKKITPEYLEHLLKLQDQKQEIERESNRQKYDDKKSKRKYLFSGIVISLIVLIGFLVFVIVYLSNQPALMEKLILGFFTFITGLASGLGLKSLFGKNDEKE